MTIKHKLTGGHKTKAQMKKVTAFFEKCKKQERTQIDNEDQIKEWCTKAVHDHVILAGYEINMYNNKTYAIVTLLPVDGDIHGKIAIHLKGYSNGCR